VAAGSARIEHWQAVFQGVEMCSGSTKNPRPVQIKAVRVDLQAEGISFLVTPSNGAEPKDVGARTTSGFLAEFKCQVAINGSVFAPLAKAEGDPMEIEGLSLSRGDLYSPANKYDAILISTNNRVWLDMSPVDATGAWNGMSGFYTLLVEGRNIGSSEALHPRSAIGVSRDGRYLILMAIDGRQPGDSAGATTAETAEWMRKLGAWNALNLDGGGSTALVIEGPEGRPRVLNRPSGPPPGTERRVGNHLGVYARAIR
jgi:exopolysaccharide biosynthesis protein